jgi:hypothetical protein
MNYSSPTRFTLKICWPFLLAALTPLLSPSPAAAAIPVHVRCLLVDDESSLDPVNFENAEKDGGPVEEIPGVRAPRADEVGRPAGPKYRSITPLTGIPLDTSWDSVGWIPQGMAPGKNGDLNIKPDHPTSGAVSAIVPHPTNQSILYIGTVNGGVWRTDNALDPNPRWRPLTDDQLSLSIGGLAMDPTDANTLVAGFGRRSSIAFLGGAHKGIIRTTDGGATWTKIGGTALDGRLIHYLTVRGDIIMASVDATDNQSGWGLYRSSDGGANWTNISGISGNGLPLGKVDHLVADPSSSTRYYCHVIDNGVYRSDNSGANWINVLAGAQAAIPNDVALAVSGGGVVFAATLGLGSTPTFTSNVYRSIDHGATWTQMDSFQANASHMYNGFVVDKADSNVVYLSGLYTHNSFPYEGRVVRGNARGAKDHQWTSVASTAAQGFGTAPHTDSRALAVTSGGRLVEGDDGGIYELNNPSAGSEGDVSTGGGSWRSLNGNLQNSEMHSMAYDPVAAALFGGAQDTGVLMQLKMGERPWDTPIDSSGIHSSGDGGDAAVDLLASSGQCVRYYSNQYFGTFRRRIYDAGNNLVPGSESSPRTTLHSGDTAIIANSPDKGGNMPFVTPISTNAVAGNRLVISGKNVFYESLDGGATVNQIANVPAVMGKIAYGGRSNGTDAPDALLFCRPNTRVLIGRINGQIQSATFPPGTGTGQGVVFDPENWLTDFVITTNEVYEAIDPLETGIFFNITGNLNGVGTLHTIQYLTLPSGNAIVVGADLGAFIMRVAEPGVWRTLGDNLPHAPVFDSDFDPVGQVLAVSTLGRGTWLYDFKQTKTTGQYGETFQALVPGTTVMPARTGEFFSSNTNAAQVVDDNLRELQMTVDGTGLVRTAFRLPDLDPGRAIAAFSARWNASIYGDSSQLADGFSFNFGPLGSFTDANLTSANYNQEDGFKAGLTVSVRTYSDNSPGYYVRVNGAEVAGGRVAKAPADWGNFNTTRHFFEVDWRLDTGLTLRVDGVAIFTNLPTPGYSPAAGDRFVFGSRTGGFDETVALDNIAIFTGGVLVPVQPIKGVAFSDSDIPDDGLDDDNAFDGNVETQWLSLNYTGYLGTRLASPKRIRMYTLTSANNTPGRDPATWDFQNGDNGRFWAQHGVQSAQFFASRREQRAFVVANPSSASEFRVQINENHLSSRTDLAEFQVWEFVPISVVANNNTSGAGSLRQVLIDAQSVAGRPTTITFLPALSGQTITLTDGHLEVSSPDGISIDASALVGGLTITADNGSRLFYVKANAVCSLTGLTLTGGGGVVDGGAIRNLGRLSLTRCTLTGNSAKWGGAIFNTTDFSTQLSLTYCTISGNTASAYGGGIYNFIGWTTLNHCTVAQNTAPAGAGSGVASYGDSSTITLVRDSIIAQNTNSDVDFVVHSDNNSFNSRGNNLVGTGNALPGFNETGDMVNTAPLLAPLDKYGGPTKTMALILGSPARNAGSNITFGGDQRNYPIVGVPDIGAYEAGTFDNYNAFIWESLPASASVAQHATSFDFDGDGANNFAEWLGRTDPGDPTSVLRIVQVAQPGTGFSITFPTVTGRIYTVEYSLDLQAWTVFTSIQGNGSNQTVTISPVGTQLFVRVRPGP